MCIRDRLAEHIKGVQTNSERLSNEIHHRQVEVETLRETLKKLDERVEKTEFLPDLVSKLKTSIMWLAGLIGGISIIMSIWGS